MIKRKYGRHVSLKKKSRKSGRVVHKTSKNTLRKGRRGTRSHHIHGGTCPLNTFNCSWPQMWGGNDDDAYFKYRVTPILPNETTASKTPFNRDATIQNIDKLVSDVKRCIYHFPEKNIINSNNYSCIGIVIPFTDKIVSEKQRVSDIFIKYQLDDTMFNDFWNLYAIHLTKNEMGTSGCYMESKTGKFYSLFIRVVYNDKTIHPFSIDKRELEGFKESVEFCKNKNKRIFIFCYLQNTDPNEAGHCTGIIIEKNKHSEKSDVFYYDPHGSDSEYEYLGNYNPREMTLFLLKQVGFRQNEYVIKIDRAVCPRGLQDIVSEKRAISHEDNIYCVYFTLLTMITYFMNPNLSYRTVETKLIDLCSRSPTTIHYMLNNIFEHFIKWLKGFSNVFCYNYVSQTASEDYFFNGLYMYNEFDKLEYLKKDYSYKQWLNQYRLLYYKQFTEFIMKAVITKKTDTIETNLKIEYELIKKDESIREYIKNQTGITGTYFKSNFRRKY